MHPGARGSLRRVRPGHPPGIIGCVRRPPCPPPWPNCPPRTPSWRAWSNAMDRRHPGAGCRPPALRRPGPQHRVPAAGRPGGGVDPRAVRRRPRRRRLRRAGPGHIRARAARLWAERVEDGVAAGPGRQGRLRPGRPRPHRPAVRRRGGGAPDGGARRRPVDGPDVPDEHAEPTRRVAGGRLRGAGRVRPGLGLARSHPQGARQHGSRSAPTAAWWPGTAGGRPTSGDGPGGSAGEPRVQRGEGPVGLGDPAARVAGDHAGRTSRGPGRPSRT